MAQVIINEANPNLSSGSRDLIELLVTQEGNLFGMTLEQDITLATTWAAFPAVHVKKDDIVVVHTTPVPAGGQSETTQKNQFPRNAADYAENFDNAWDLMGT